MHAPSDGGTLPRMPSLSRLLVPLAAAAALTAVPAASASILPPKERTAKFWVSAKGTQKTTWKGRTTSGGDCYYQWSMTPKGTEEVTFRSRKAKLFATAFGKNVFFNYGAWQPYAGSGALSWKGTGSTTRTDTSDFHDGPGACGAKAEPPERPADDCGTHRRRFELSLAYDPRHEELALNVGNGGGKAFDACQVMVPLGVQDDAVTTIAEDIPISDLFGDFDKQVILGRHAFATPREGSYSAYTSINWQLTLTRHR